MGRSRPNFSPKLEPIHRTIFSPLQLLGELEIPVLGFPTTCQLTMATACGYINQLLIGWKRYPTVVTD